MKIIALEEDESFDDLKVEIALLKQCSHKNIVKYVGSWKKGEELFVCFFNKLSFLSDIFHLYYLIFKIDCHGAL